MPHQPRIRWTSSQLRQLRRDVSVFNRARTMAIKKDPAIEQFLPQKLNVKQLREEITTRQELKELTDKVDYEVAYQFEVFEQPGGGHILRSELELARQLAVKSNQLKAREAKKRGLKPPKPKEMLDLEQADLMPVRTDVENVHAKNWARYVASVEAKSDPSYFAWEAQSYKDQYIESMWKALGATEDVLEIEEFIKNIPADEFVRAAREDEVLRIRYLYANNPSEVEAIKKDIREHWSSYR